MSIHTTIASYMKTTIQGGKMRSESLVQIQFGAIRQIFDWLNSKDILTNSQFRENIYQHVI